MTPQHLIIKYQMLQLSAFDGHQYCPMGAVQWGDNPFRARVQMDCPLYAFPDAQAASQAYFFIQVCPLCDSVIRVCQRDKGKGIHRTGINAFSASGATMLMNFRHEVGGMNRVQHGKSLGCKHGLAAAFTAVADEIYSLAHIFPELDQAVLICREQ
jgi:hypothetical protein